MKIIVGLGNPGEKYQKNRHNVGFMFLDFLAGVDTSWKFNKKFNAFILERGSDILVKPQTFINNSGMTVRAILDYYKLIPKKFGLFTNKNSDLSEVLTVVHDDLDIDFGNFKISIGAGSAGHNGVSSIINHLKTKNFKRIRLGINNEFKANISGENFVLQNFSKNELDELNNIFQKIVI
ncbi:MAG: aminoacyl-tRNA hydrolase [Patescibacteria group bacterium]|nr:aminoacyl-tRNA hydrolase [Patescibacteria group bacterium]